ncbi:alpha-acetolactate decarboxylase [Synechococcus sp. RS9909]|nr:alpha-acetolactate decarboxylase [Synechococcus sp. RS9909]
MQKLHTLPLHLGEGLWQELLADVQSWEDLTSHLDRLRDNNNLFVGLRLEGRIPAGERERHPGGLLDPQLCPHDQRAGIPPASAQR